MHTVHPSDFGRKNTRKTAISNMPQNSMSWDEAFGDILLFAKRFFRLGAIGL